MSVSSIIGRDGRMLWDNYPIALKFWKIECDQPGGGTESWHGKAIISQTDLLAMMEEHAKSGPIPINLPIFADFHKGKKVYSGRFVISSYPDPIDSNPLINFTGTGKLKEHYSAPAPGIVAQKTKPQGL